MATAQYNSRFCATCEHFGGSRSLNSGKDRVDYDSNAKGKCYAKKSGGYYLEVKAGNSTCSNHKKWSQFK